MFYGKKLKKENFKKKMYIFIEESLPAPKGPRPI
jgi:hypothetical protein